MTNPTSSAQNQLRRNSLGLIAVTFMVVSAAAPLTGVAGAVPIAMLIGNGAGVPATFLFMTLIMLAFAAGYVAMSRHVKNAGAFYAYAARALGGRAAGAVSMIALLSYNCMQFGLAGLLGGIATGVFADLGIVQPWWVWSLLAILLVGVLGYRQVDLSARVLIVLVVLEYLIVLLVDFAILGAGGAEGLSLNLFDADALFSGSLTASILFCLGSFIGIEATTIYAEEARDADRTIPRATYLSVLLIGLFFVFTTWLMVVAAPAGKLQDTIGALPDPTGYFFELAGQYVGGPVPMIAGLLLVSSLFAALSAFHNYIARYTYVAGREGLLPAAFGRTHDRHQSPHAGSLLQTGLSIIVVALFALLGLDPIGNLFAWIAQIAVMGVLGMLAITCLSVIVFFGKTPDPASALVKLVLPGAAGIIMALLFGYVFLNFGDLTGTAGGWLGWALPALVPVSGLLGWMMAGALANRDPAAFARMGQNA
ncbi:APC family permease [Gemmobacter denitrificans]|uniref:APC family permease n=1 Tax=Gemmobacter denitrificans TaxID=3123040 RepID=A0ABU8BZG3_9RHOB